MDEEALQQVLDSACKDSGLYFQVIQQVPYLYIYINRDEDTSVDFVALSDTIHQAIAPLHLPEIEFLALYSRVLGTTEPDWETTLALRSPQASTEARNLDSDEAIPSEQPEITTGVIEAESVLAELDLSQYCFVRNQLFLTSQLKAAPEEIARSIAAFDKLTAAEKAQALPLLETYFQESSPPPVDSLSPEVRAWFEAIASFDTSQIRKLKIWMSRYCQRPEETLAELAAVLGIATDTEGVSQTEERGQLEEIPAISTDATKRTRSASHTRQAAAPLARRRRSGAAGRNARWADSFAAIPPSVLVAVVLGGIALVWGLAAGVPIKFTCSAATMIVTLTLLFKPYFGDFSGFLTCILFFLTPDIFSLFQGKYFEDLIAELKLFAWVACGFVASLLVYSLFGTGAVPQ